MAIIGLAGVTHYFGDNCILDKISFSVEDHHRIGLVGRNGSGKTTLLDILGGRLTPNQGSIHKPKGLGISYLYQSMEQLNSRSSNNETRSTTDIDPGTVSTEDLDLLSYVIRSHQRVYELHIAIDELLKQIADDPGPKNLKLLDQYERELHSLDGYNIETKAKTVLQNLAFGEDCRHRPIKSFSGGEQTRIQLAATLISPAGLYLFDEPTNHLDIHMRDWLESYLLEIKQPYIIVSHDRHFLEKTTNTTLNLENKSVTTYSGNYRFFEHEYLRQQEQQQKAYQAQQSYIEKTRQFIRKNLAGQKTKQAQSRRKALEKINLLEKPDSEQKLNLSIESAKRSGNIVFSFDRVSVGFPEKKLASGIEKTVYYQDRVAILGENGCGKTTFLQVMFGEMQPLTGKVNKGASLSIGYYDQMHINLNHTLTVAETISAAHTRWTKHDVLSYLAGYGFYQDDIEKNVNLLSGGEKARLYLALLISGKPNLLIMDEPTNHLDIPTIKVLERALTNYDGTVIFVSQDRLFINNIANRFWLFKNKHIIEPIDWEKELLSSLETPAKHCKKPVKTRTKANKKKTNPQLLERKLKQIGGLEDMITSNEELLLHKEMQFTDKKTMKDRARIKELNSEIVQLRETISSLKNDLESLEEDYLSCIE